MLMNVCTSHKVISTHIILLIFVVFCCAPNVSIPFNLSEHPLVPTCLAK